MTTVSIIIPTLFPPPTLHDYAERLTKYKDVREVIIAINSDKMAVFNDQNSSNNQSSIINNFNSITHHGSIIKSLVLGKNMGFTGACNAGARASTGNNLLFLNDDCEMDEVSFVKMVEFLDKNQDLVATQPVVYKAQSGQLSVVSEPQEAQTTDLSDSGRARMTNLPAPHQLFTLSSSTKFILRVVEGLTVNSVEEPPAPSDVVENIGFVIDTKIGKATAITDSSQWTGDRLQQKSEFNGRHPGLPGRQAGTVQDQTTDLSYSGLARMTNLPAPCPLPTKNSELRTKNYIYGLSGTCLLIRRTVFEDLGMWDESFHSYLEDVDLAIRIDKKGLKLAPCLSARVTHTHMATSSRMGIYKPIQDMNNWWRLIFKHPDVFVRADNLIPMLIERIRNLSGVMKKYLELSASCFMERSQENKIRRSWSKYFGK